MGCAGSRGATTTIDVQASTWAEAYERHASNHGDRTRSLRRQGTYSEGGATIVKSGTSLRQINDYNVTAALGKGAFGEVFLASRRSDHEKYAIKVLKKSKLKKMGKPMRPGMRMTEGLSSIKVEIATMKKIAHPSAQRIAAGSSHLRHAPLSHPALSSASAAAAAATALLLLRLLLLQELPSPVSRTPAARVGLPILAVLPVREPALPAV
jgi:serine/threonine protein kinase